VGLSKYQRLAYRTLGGVAARSAHGNEHLKVSLERAHIYLRPDVYLGYSYLNMLVAFAGTFALVLLLAMVRAAGLIAVPASVFVFLIPVPIVLAGSIYLLTFLIPDLRASSRARDIDTKLPYALNYIATMASAGVTPHKIFESLARQEVYGEVANEAAWITRDLQLLGRDVVGALGSAVERSPSIKFQDLLQGAITTLTSGGDLKTYFQSKSEQFMYDNRQEQKRALDSLGVLAESFVTVVVAGPVFLLVMLSVMTMFGSDPRSSLSLGYLVILVMIPLAQLGFAGAIKTLTPEV